MDSSRDCGGHSQPKQKPSQESVSSISNQTPNPQLSAANIPTRPSPNNAQGENIAQNETSEKAQSGSRRFSRGRKRQEEKSPTVGATNQTDAVKQPSSNNIQDDAADETGRQNGTRKRRKRRPRARREENVSNAVKSDENAPPQNDAKGKESANHSRIRQKEQRHLQETPEGNKNIALKGIDNSLSKEKSQDDARVAGEEGRVQDDDVQKQGQNTRNEQKIATGKESRQKKLTQSGQLNGATRNLEEPTRQDKIKKQGTRGDQKNVETGTSGVANSKGEILPQNDMPNGSKGEGGSQTNTRKQGQKRSRNTRKANNKVLVEQDVQKVHKERKSDMLDVNNNTSQSSVKLRTTQNKTTETRPESVPDKDPSGNKRKAKKKKQKTGSQSKTQSLEAMRNLLSEGPKEIVNWLLLQQSSLFGKKQQKRKDEVVALLVKLLAKACDCKCHSGLENLFSVLSKSWFLTRRVGHILDQLSAKKSKTSQTKHFDLETLRDLAKVLKEILNRFPKASAELPIVKLHSSTMKLARSGELIDREISATVQELMELRKKEEVTRCRQEVMQRSRPFKTGNLIKLFFAFASWLVNLSFLLLFYFKCCKTNFLLDIQSILVASCRI